MKTPREMLFARHSPAEPKLDAVRQHVLASLARPSAAAAAPAEGRIGAVFSKAWQELIWPSRWAWGSMAALWVAVLAVNLGMNATSPAGPVARATPSREVVRAFEEQRRLLTELLPGTELPVVQAPRPVARPRSERPSPYKAC